jgi:hypothetical protein
MTTVPTPPWRDDNETTTAGRERACPVCARGFRPVRRQTYCTPACRKAAWRRRHQPALTPAAIPATRPRRPVTVYACPDCQTRYVGEQRCLECNTWCARVGLGGLCPHCDEPVAVEELVPVAATAEDGS